ncbi:MAG: YidC/Oxa1 family membrane protein insertase [Oscillospiraceae bacterium]|nr:YidC/Oxa1 family membrane protein insertase [Oscillospiraceae bacterium]
MNIIDLTFGAFFGQIMRVCDMLTGDFGLTLLLFTVLTKLILLPVSLISQKNAIVMVKLQPALLDLQARYEGELSTLIKEQKALYKKEKYSAIKALLPLLAQIPLIIGVISVVNNPMRHLAETTNHVFFGIDLFALPETLLIPAAAIVSTLLLCVTQNIYNVISREQGFFGKWGVTIALTAFTGWFAFICPAGLGLYWTFSNILGIAVLALCNLIYNPKKYIDYENRSIKPKLTREEKQAKCERKAREKIREKEDMKRFFSTSKELVFYSESSGFYKYFQGIIEYILENSDITVHYLSSDINDRVFELKKPRLETYFCSAHGMITAFMKMDADIVVMTMPDLDVYHYKRSIVRRDIEYIYTDHGHGSVNLMLRRGALDNYDTIFCNGKSYNDEIRAAERVYELKEKNLVNAGFSLLDMLIERYEAEICGAEGGRAQILIAPSWQKDNLLEYCLEPVLRGLLDTGAKIIIRPHPEFVKRFPGKMKDMFSKYAARIEDKTLEIQTDFSSNSTVYESDLVVTDWSSIALEFSLTTKKPSLFINTPMKVMNAEWKKLDIEPVDLQIRDKIGVSVDTDELDDAKRIKTAAEELLKNRDKYKAAIMDFLAENMYNVGDARRVGGEYIIGQIKTRRAAQAKTQTEE